MTHETASMLNLTAGTCIRLHEQHMKPAAGSGKKSPPAYSERCVPYLHSTWQTSGESDAVPFYQLDVAATPEPARLIKASSRHT